MIYTCNVKGLEEVEKLGINKCNLHRTLYLWFVTLKMDTHFRKYQIAKSTFQEKDSG